MKTIAVKIIAAITLVLTIALPANAQELTHLRNVELEEFDQIRVTVDTEVILIKSKRNRLTLVGDSAYVAEFPVIQKGDILSFSHKESDSGSLTKIVIEYKEIDKAITGGTGVYTFVDMKARNLEIYNPYASLTLEGRAKNVRIFSEEGDNDVTGLKADKIVLHMGETATLLKSKNTRLVSSRRFK